MADNYLENKMEEHRRMMAQGGARKKPATPWAGGPVKFDERRVIVAVSEPSLRDETVRLMRKAGYPTAFCSIDARSGQKLAQDTGSRFYPVAGLSPESVASVIDDYSKTRGVPHFIITDNEAIGPSRSIRRILYTAGEQVACTAGTNAIAVDKPDSDSAPSAATLALFLTHQATDRLDGMVFRI